MSNWNPSSNTLDLIEKSTNDLISNFASYLAGFEDAFINDKTFAGPSLYFHYQCINQFIEKSVLEKTEDIRFYEYLYATLTSWGMHRMGDTATKLHNFDWFRSEIYKYKEIFHELEKYRIWEISSFDATHIIHQLTSIMDEMRISKADSSLVANTKVIHHILPNLIPPIDRRYTLSFFCLNTMLPSYKPASQIFSRLYPSFIEISIALSKFINEKINLVEENWNTSFTKVIDNAIIGSFK